MLNSFKVGEIMAKGGIPMKCYLNRPEENAKFFAEDGFFHTGDLAHYDVSSINMLARNDTMMRMVFCTLKAGSKN
jgi:long-subunit acyl-CoA synthetase (AMP-forming)